MDKENAGKPTYSDVYNSLMEKLKNRDMARQLWDEELRSLKTAIDDEMIRREVVKHIQVLANQLK